MRTSVSVIIASAGRPEILHETVCRFARSAPAVVEIIISAPNDSSVARKTRDLPNTVVVLAPLGVTVQRNRGIDSLRAASDVVLFLDDDVEVGTGFVDALARTFEERPDVCLVGGVDILHETGLGQISREAARHLLQRLLPFAQEGDTTTLLGSRPRWGCTLCRARHLAWSGSRVLVESAGVVGYAMAVRRPLLERVRFDERLVLYGYLEDLDFSAECRRLGRVVYDTGACVAHLEAPGGRASEFRRGFSEVANPWYLWRKGNAAFWRTVLLAHLVRRPIRNLVRAVRHSAARERLKGNATAVRCLLCGCISPEQAAAIKG